MADVSQSLRELEEQYVSSGLTNHGLVLEALRRPGGASANQISATLYAGEALRATRFGGSVTTHAFLASVKVVRRWKDGVGRRRLTAADWQWLRRELPRDAAAAKRERMAWKHAMHSDERQ